MRRSEPETLVLISLLDGPKHGYAIGEDLGEPIARDPNGVDTEGLAALADEARTMIFFESPHRVAATLADAHELLNQASMARPFPGATRSRTGSRARRSGAAARRVPAVQRR